MGELWCVGSESGRFFCAASWLFCFVSSGVRVYSMILCRDQEDDKDGKR